MKIKKILEAINSVPAIDMKVRMIPFDSENLKKASKYIFFSLL